tara:strand:- start:4624 stop:5445 length:822 start_codon:yes stop_codon:yes gene_type:complete
MTKNNKIIKSKKNMLKKIKYKKKTKRMRGGGSIVSRNSYEVSPHDYLYFNVVNNEVIDLTTDFRRNFINIRWIFDNRTGNAIDNIKSLREHYLSISREGAMNPNRMYDNMRNTTITLEESQQNISDLNMILEYLRNTPMTDMSIHNSNFVDSVETMINNNDNNDLPVANIVQPTVNAIRSFNYDFNNIGNNHEYLENNELQRRPSIDIDNNLELERYNRYVERLRRDRGEPRNQSREMDILREIQRQRQRRQRQEQRQLSLPDEPSDDEENII